MNNLVLIHANSSSKKTFSRLKSFINDEYNIVSFDLPGHGDNQKNIEKFNFTFTNLLNFCLDEINRLDGDVILYGNSLGGHLAIEVAPKVKFLKGIVISGTPPLKKPLNMEEAFNPLEELSIFFENETDTERVRESIDFLTFNNDCLDEIVQDYLDTNKEFRLSIAQNITTPDLFENELEIFKSLECEKLIVKGDTDKTTSISYLENVAKLVDCRIIEIENCGHYPQIEKPKKFSKILNNFCKDCFS